MFIKYYLESTIHMKSGKTLKFDTDIGSPKQNCIDSGNSMVKMYCDFCHNPSNSGYFNFGSRYFNVQEFEGFECILRKKFLGIKLP